MWPTWKHPIDLVCPKSGSGANFDSSVAVMFPVLMCNYYFIGQPGESEVWFQMIRG